MNTKTSPFEFDAASAAALIDSERSRASARERRMIATIVVTWGVVWLVGYLALWSGETGGNPWFRLPDGFAWWILAGLLAVGIAVSAVVGIAMGKDTRGPSNRIGALYGISFGVGSSALMAFNVGLVNAGISDEVASLLFPGSFTLLVAAMYMAGSGASAKQRIDLAQFLTGVALLVFTVVATFIGSPHHYLVYAFAGFAFFAGAAALLRERD